jgi:hypothetical protein
MTYPHGGASQIWRDPATHNPRKSEIRDWGAAVEVAIDALEEQAFASDPIYADTAAGLAATSEGQQFKVENASADVTFDIYRHDAGPVATLITSVPSTLALAAKADAADLAAHEGNTQNPHEVTSAQVGVAALLDPLNIRFDNLERQNRILAGNVVNLLAHTGQSEGVPRGNSRVSTTAPSGARMFESGVWPHFVSTPAGFDSALVADSSNNSSHNIYMERLASLVSLAEYSDDGGKESLSTGCAWWLPDAETVSWYAGEGSQTVESLSGSGIHFSTEALMLVEFGSLVKAEGKEPVWPFSIFTQGHADAFAGTDPAVWKQAVLDLQQYRTDLASAAWGYDVPLVPFITEVLNNSGYATTNGAFSHAEAYENTRAIMQAQSVIAEENSSVYCAGPTYQWATEDGVHTDGRERRLRGEMFGKVGRRIKDGLSWEHCNIRSATLSGSDITVSVYVPVGDLVSDTVLVDDPGDLGFEVFDSGGGSLTVSSVSIGATVGGLCDVTVTVASGVPAVLRYAMQELGMAGGPGLQGTGSGARGCIRDSDTAVAVFDGSSLYNWLCPKEITL